jgi:hypothetical protein
LSERRQNRALGPAWRRRVLVAWLGCALVCLPLPILAQDETPPLRTAHFEWDSSRRLLYVGVSFRDVIDPSIRRKLKRGLPTTIVLTGAIYRPGQQQPIATTAQTCKITWHVWKEMYLIEITRPGSHRLEKTLTLNGVLRRCAEIRSQDVSRLLLAANSSQVPVGAPVYMQAKVQVNPLSPEVLQKIKRWVSRPMGTATAAPGDALFSTFTGLFLQRIGEAERELQFTTQTVVPSIAKPKQK